MPKGNANPDKLELPMRDIMAAVNKARVGFKHYGQLPTSAQAARFVGDTGEFLRAAARRFYGVAWDELSLADVIRDEKLKAEIRALEQLLREAKFEECVHKSAVASGHARKYLDHVLPVVDPRLGDHGRPLQYVGQQLTLHRLYVGTLLLGISAGHALRFRMLVPGVQESPTGSVQIVVPAPLHQYRYSEEDARFCVDYVTDFVLRAEALVHPVKQAAEAQQEQWRALSRNKGQ